MYIETIRIKRSARNLSVDALQGGPNALKLEPRADHGACSTVTTIDGKKGPMPGVVRPSSLNYKISLLEAVVTYIKKEKLQADQYWDVDVEEHNGRTGPK